MRIVIVVALIAAGAAWMFRIDILPGAGMAFVIDRWTGKITLCIEGYCAPIETFMPKPLPEGIIPKPRKE